jgi:hypothetical protein
MKTEIPEVTFNWSRTAIYLSCNFFKRLKIEVLSSESLGRRRKRPLTPCFLSLLNSTHAEKFSITNDVRLKNIKLHRDAEWASVWIRVNKSFAALLWNVKGFWMSHLLNPFIWVWIFLKCNVLIFAVNSALKSVLYHVTFAVLIQRRLVVIQGNIGWSDFLFRVIWDERFLRSQYSFFFRIYRSRRKLPHNFKITDAIWSCKITPVPKFHAMGTYEEKKL